MSPYHWGTWLVKSLFINSTMEDISLWKSHTYQRCLNYPPGIKWLDIHVWFGHIVTCVPLV
eukprot:12891255-Prorocentrum_lima.AAC.1